MTLRVNCKKHGNTWENTKVWFAAQYSVLSTSLKDVWVFEIKRLQKGFFVFGINFYDIFPFV